MKQGKKAAQSKPPPDHHEEQKVYGKPLQNLYHQLMQLKKAPTQATLIRALSDSLGKKSISYHPRTLKRQLLGNIEYIPETLEQALLQWMKKTALPGNQKLLASFHKEKQQLADSLDNSFYISPQFFIRMAEGYLYLHKQLSRRQLAVKLQQSLKQKKIKIGLETFQAALAGKTKKIKKALEDILREYYTEEGYKNSAAIEKFLVQAEKEAKQETKKVDIGSIGQVIEAYLIKFEGQSKRQIALKIQKMLKAKGYEYHLSSIQSVLEGKTKKTRKAIPETIYEMLKEGGIEQPEKIQEYLSSVPESQRHWHHYTVAENIPEIVENILQKHPSLTRRRLAIMLRKDLQEKNFDFSLNTLQYVLAGKTKKTRQIVLDLLNSYLNPESFENTYHKVESVGSPTKGRPSISKKLQDVFEKLNTSDEKDRNSLQQTFRDTRIELIKKRWANKFQKSDRNSSKNRSMEDIYEEVEDTNSHFGESSSSEDLYVSYDVNASLDRLVS